VVPFVKPATTALNALPEAVVTAMPPGLAVTVYEVIGEPPLDAGAAQVTVACPLPGVALTPVGAPGTVATVGVTAAEGLLGGESPSALVATTVNV
jgi:hypothetical protein